VRKQVPEARLRVMGRLPEDTSFLDHAGIDPLGFVEDAGPEIATWSAMVVPLHLGGGTRVKISEGFSRKVPMVSTSLGAYGYDLRDGEEIRLADSAGDFAAACVDLVRSPDRAASMAEKGWRRFLSEWTWDAIRPRVETAAEDCLRRGTPAPAASHGA